MTTVVEQSPIQMPELPCEIPDVPVWRLSVEQYEQFIETGVLENADELELLEGWLVPKMGKNPPHGAVTRRLNTLIKALVGDSWDVHTQDPIKLTDSCPEPDVSVVVHDPDDYLYRTPALGEVGLVIEVSDTTLRRDRGIKQRLYARAGLSDYWIVNVEDGWIELYTDPTGPCEKPLYRQRTDYQSGQLIPVRLKGVIVGELMTRDILP